MKNLLLLFVLTGVLWSQSEENPVTISASVGSIARAGEVVPVKISAAMDEEWHIYSIYKISEGPLPSEISVGGSAVGAVTPVIEPEPMYVYDPGFETDTYYHKGDTEFIFPVNDFTELDTNLYSNADKIIYIDAAADFSYPNNKIYTFLESFQKNDKTAKNY